MKYILLGLVARLVAGMLSWWIHRRQFDRRAEPAQGPSEGLDPAWMSTLNVASIACIMAGVGAAIL